MNKKPNLKSYMRVPLLFLLGIFVSSSLLAQDGARTTVTGVVNDHYGDPAIGASIMLRGTVQGTMTDIDGNFSIQAPGNGILEISYVGYKTEIVSINGRSNIVVNLKVDDSVMLDEVVAIGYGAVKKDDLTGSVVAIKAEELNKGITTSPQDLLTGKIAGVSVVSGGGQPGGGSTIRIRGGSSLTANNDPLIVIDGVIMGSSSVDGLSNPLSTINPSDIESFSVLKDASASAIYGSRAANGVILITTKKGQAGSKIKFSYNGSATISTPRNKYDVLSADEYREFIINNPNTSDAMLNALNQYPDQSTDWQDEVFRTSLSTDHNFSVYGSINKVLPYRVSVGYTNDNGILKNSNFERFSGNVNLNPSLFDDHLKVNLTAKGAYIKNRFADTGAVGGAVNFDPTKPVKNDNTKYGGYYTWTTDGTPDGGKTGSSPINPVSLLEMKNDDSTVKSFVGSAQFDYKVHFFPDLRVFLNLSTDYSTSDGDNYVSPIAPSNYSEDPLRSGSQSLYGRTNKNNLFEVYGQYAKNLPSLSSHFDIMAGHSYQSEEWDSHSTSYYLSREEATFGQQTEINGDPQINGSKNVVASFFGRFNYTLKERYLLTFTFRADGTSRMHKDNRWGYFPSLALAWRMNDEAFFKNVDPLSNLKLRLGWGITGQQNITSNDYPYLSTVRYGKGGVMYPFYQEDGSIKWINVAGITAPNPNLKWEETTTWNVGIDYGFLNNRISGSIDYYYKDTKDLINDNVNLPAGAALAEYVISNIGTMENKGVEFSINATPVVTKDFSWDVGFNIANYKTKITALTFDDENSTSPGNMFESTGGDGGKAIKIHSVGYAPGTFYVFEQIYNEDGKPIEGAYVDRTGDGVLNNDDRYHYKKPEADVLMGFNSKISYKNWDFGFNGRASIGNYNFNAMAANNAAINVTGLFANNCSSNRPASALETMFNTRQRLSDYYIQNASFLKIDNITLGYSFPKLSAIRNGSLRIYATVQNPIVITKYDGLDPEVFGGMDNNVYPRPLSFIVGLNLNF